MRVGFIGIGTMGVGISANMKKAGFDMVVHDARRQAAEDAGLARADRARAADAGRAADVGVAHERTAAQIEADAGRKVAEAHVVAGLHAADEAVDASAAGHVGGGVFGIGVLRHGRAA